MGRHRKPPVDVLPAEADLLLEAISSGRPVVEEGVAVLPGGTVPYAYRTEAAPDGTVRRELLRLAPGLFPELPG
ncbi:hypothetical protein ACFV4P_02875 [Kitasatospora sp. NPDC059795]|uniref:hypothetical protein n=1 Tax=Kitasatospora sp. NPDC059795 TaxID=3346949 RepID=UPI00364DB426